MSDIYCTYCTVCIRLSARVHAWMATWRWLPLAGQNRIVPSASSESASSGNREEEMMGETTTRRAPDRKPAHRQ